MRLERDILTRLADWKDKASRKPLILQGVRQVGKTWLLKHFGSVYFDDTAYFNFEKQKELEQFFSSTKDPERIIDNLALVQGRPIVPQKTLIIFDEIQECNDALNSLKYFSSPLALSTARHCLRQRRNSGPTTAWAGGSPRSTRVIPGPA